MGIVLNDTVKGLRSKLFCTLPLMAMRLLGVVKYSIATDHRTNTCSNRGYITIKTL